MKEIYIILTHTGTVLSKIIKSYTKDEFSHISISLDAELEEMYSFGRLRPYNAFIGGFVHEYIDKGTFQRFRNTMSKIYSLEVTEEQYEKIENSIREIQKEKDIYKFNILGLIAAGLNKKIKGKHSFYCAEFVKYVIEKADMNIALPEIVKPEDFKNIQGLNEIYSGLLRDYKSSKINIANILKDNLLRYAKKEEMVQ